MTRNVRQNLVIWMVVAAVFRLKCMKTLCTYLHPLQKVIPIQHVLLQWVLALLIMEEQLHMGGTLFACVCVHVITIYMCAVLQEAMIILL